MKRISLAILLVLSMVISNITCLYAAETGPASEESAVEEAAEEETAVEESVVQEPAEDLPAEEVTEAGDGDEEDPSQTVPEGSADAVSGESAEGAEDSDGAELIEETAAEQSVSSEAADADSTPQDVPQAIWTEADGTLTFSCEPQVTVGDFYGGVTITNVWSGTDVTATGEAGPLWNQVIRYKVRKVRVDSSFAAVKPTSTCKWFDTCCILESADLDALDTSAVTCMDNMFAYCEVLEDLDVSGFDTSAVTSMKEMFACCNGLEELDIHTWDTSHVTSMERMFMSCSGLKRVTVNGLDTSQVTSTATMFSGCVSLSELDLSDWSLPQDEDCTGMFAGCTGLESLDLSAFEPSDTVKMASMFGRCTALQTIYCKDAATDWSSREGSYMFYACTSLTGSYGDTVVHYDANSTHASMARAASLGGYLTPKPSGETIVKQGMCGRNAWWELDEKGTLTISGGGPIDDYPNYEERPWHADAGSIKKIVVREGITRIGNFAFAACPATEIELPDTLLTIGYRAFTETDIWKIWIPEKVETIGDHAFYQCGSLKYVTIGERVDRIEEGCFGSCGALLAVCFMGTPGHMAEDTFSSCGDLSGLYAEERAGYWNDSNKKNYGAASITWETWDEDVLFEFSEDEYTVHVGETSYVTAVYSSRTLPLFSGVIYPPSTDLYDYKMDRRHEYESVIIITVTGRNAGQTTLTMTGYTPVDRDPMEISTTITIIEGSAQEDDPDEISDSIKYSLEDTYQFGNLTDAMELKHYLKYFGRVQSGIFLKDDNGTGGQCFGMVYTAAATVCFDHPPVSSYSGENSSLYKIGKFTRSSVTEMTASQYIKYGQAYQYSVPVQKQKILSSKEPLEKLYQKVVDYLQSSDDSVPPVCITVKDKNSGEHALLVRGISSNTDSCTKLVVYDCNHPGKKKELKLNKKKGKYTSWSYFPWNASGDWLVWYLSQEDGVIQWADCYQDFIDDFDNEQDMSEGHQLISVSGDGSTIRTKEGNAIRLTPRNTSDPIVLIPITQSNGSESEDAAQMYWLNLQDGYTIESADSECAYEIASPNSGVAFTLPADSEARVRVGEEIDNAVTITAPAGGDFSVTFTDTNSEDTGVDTCSVFGSTDGQVSVSQYDGGYLVSGQGLETVTLETEDGQQDYQIPDDRNVALISADGTAVYDSLKDLSLCASARVRDDLVEYTGAPMTPEIVVEDTQGQVLEQDVDYRVTYLDNTEIGTARALITGTGLYAGTLEVPFRIRSVYRVTYVLNGAEDNSQNPACYDKGTKLSLKAPTRTGYTFAGWYTDKKFSAKKKVTAVSGGNKTVYAKWTVNKYNIAFSGNGSTSGRMKKLSGIAYTTTKTLTANAFKKKGYSFTSWNTKKDGSGDNYSNKAKVKSLSAKNKATVTLYAQWKIVNYKITYTLNGSDAWPALNAETNPATYTVKDRVVLAKPTREHYVFAGWYADRKFKKRVTTIAAGSTGNRTLYAKWTPIKYSITFSKNNESYPDTPAASGSMKSMTGVAWNTTKTLTANGFTKKGYTFVGWNTVAVPTEVEPGTTYANKAKVRNLAGEQGAKVTLYAQWKLTNYKINYNVTADVDNSMNPATYTMEDPDIEIQVPVRPGYDFVGWYADAKFKKKAGLTIVSGSTGVRTFYPKWKAHTYKVTFVNNDASYPDTEVSTGTMKIQTLTYGSSAKLTANAFKKTYYTMTGWNTEPDGSGQSFTNQMARANVTTEDGGEVTLYAQWAPTNYKINYVKNGGALSGEYPKTYTHFDADAKELPVPTRKGYTFQGWYTDSKFKASSKITEIPAGSSGNKTVYAKWKVKK